MKKRIICLLAALLLLLGLSVSASAAVYANVIDTAELLSESEAEALDARCSELEQTYGCGVYLVTVDDYTAYYSADSIESFAESVFLDLGLGAGEEQDGVLLVLSMAERDYDICAHGTIGNRAFTDYGKGVLAERWFLEPFGRDDWSGGFAAFLDGCEKYLRMDAEGAPFDQGTDPERLGDLAVVKWLVVILVPLLTALVYAPLYLLRTSDWRGTIALALIFPAMLWAHRSNFARWREGKEQTFRQFLFGRHEPQREEAGE